MKQLFKEDSTETAEGRGFCRLLSMKQLFKEDSTETLKITNFDFFMGCSSCLRKIPLKPRVHFRLRGHSLM